MTGGFTDPALAHADISHEARQQLDDIALKHSEAVGTGAAYGVTAAGVLLAFEGGLAAGLTAVGGEVFEAMTGIPAVNPRQAARELARGAGDLSAVARAVVPGGKCFVAGTQIRSPGGHLAIERIMSGERVMAAASTDAAWEPPEKVEIAPPSKKGTWLGRVCERVKRAARTMVLPTAMLAACDVGVPPAADEVVEVYDARTGTWFEDEAGKVAVGGELRHEGHLFRVDDSGLVDLGSVEAEALADADAAVTEVEVVAEPERASWVLVLADEDTDAGHAKLAYVEPGDRFAFQGRVYEAFGEDRVESVMETGEVLARVSRTHVRKARGVYDLDIEHADGTVETITGTEEHPFWVPALQEWVALADLEAGMVLQTYGGAEATVVGLSFVPGDIEVFNFEVEGVANYFVRGPEGDGPGVLVHNGCGDVALGKTIGLDDFASGLDAGTYRSLGWGSRTGRWQDDFLDTLYDDTKTLHVNLTDVEGGALAAAQRGASGRGSPMDWELSEIYQSPDRWKNIKWYQDGAEVANPFQR